MDKKMLSFEGDAEISELVHRVMSLDRKNKNKLFGGSKSELFRRGIKTFSKSLLIDAGGEGDMKVITIIGLTKKELVDNFLLMANRSGMDPDNALEEAVGQWIEHQEWKKRLEESSKSFGKATVITVQKKDTNSSTASTNIKKKRGMVLDSALGKDVKEVRELIKKESD